MPMIMMVLMMILIMMVKVVVMVMVIILMVKVVVYLVRPPATKSKVAFSTLNAPQAWSHLVNMTMMIMMMIMKGMGSAESKGFYKMIRLFCFFVIL